MEAKQTWSPVHWLVLAAIIGGFTMFAVGAWMLYVGIAADGAVDIKTTVASGTLKTGSAGLFIIFFSFLVIIVSLVSVMSRAPSSIGLNSSRSQSRTKKLLPVLYGVLVALLLACVGVAYFPEGARLGFLTASIILSSVIFTLVPAIVRAALDEDA